MSVQQQIPPENKNNQPPVPVGKKARSGKKGCLIGCLLATVIVFLLVAGSIYAYFNMHKILPFAMARMGVDVATVIQHAGVEAETGMPSEFLGKAYKINLPRQEGILKVASVDVSVGEAYDKFIDYFKSDGWEIKDEFEVLRGTPEVVTSFSGYMDELSAAELEKDGRKAVLAVIAYQNETVGIVWHPQKDDARTAVSKPAEVKPEHKKPAPVEPEEINGTDPENIPLYPGSVRIEYIKASEGNRIIHRTVYAVKAEKNAAMEFYRKEIENENWIIEKTLSTAELSALQAIKNNSRVYIAIRSSNDYADYTETEIVTEYLNN